MAGPSLPAVFNIPAGAPFADRLVDGLLRRLGLDGAPEDPMALARATILVPTRRAVRSVTDAFSRKFAGTVVLLPRILPLGEIDADDIDLTSAEDAPDGAFATADIPTAIPPLRRQMILASLVQKFGASAWREEPSADQAARLAAELANLLDQVETEELSFAGLETLVPDQFARHWQDTLAFFKILTLHWPEILSAEGLMDPSARRIKLLRARAAAWQRTPPQDPVIAAGSTGSIPATADLLATIARLPQGAVVLPGLDTGLSDESWATLNDSHPQFGLKALLDTIEIARGDVRPWPGSETAPSAERARLLGAALAPAAAADREGGELDAERVRAAAKGLTRIDCPTPDDEAGGIALLMREALIIPTQTCALVTPDRDLARRVAAALGRWGIDVDDSAGTPLALTPAGLYFRLAAEAAGERFAPLPLLAFLKHPLANGGLPPGEFRARVRRVEAIALRGPRPDDSNGGLEGLAAAVRARAKEPDAPMLARWLDTLAAAARNFSAALGASRRPVVEILRAHVAFLEALAATDSETGAERLWRGDDGEALAGFIAEFEDAARGFPPVGGRDYPALLSALLVGHVVRPRAGRHPRLFILGPLEARLQGADRLILGGLNEGTWPREPETDAWMSRPMRAAFKLPSPERRIGLAAHDFVQGACARDVYLTRSIRVEGTPTVPARWLVRLDHFLQRVGAPGALGADKPWLAWQAALDRPEEPPRAGRPAPCPPVAARPRKLPVTDIETWMRDPYALYAKRILKLRQLDPIDESPDAAERGTVIHRALEAFIKEFPDELPGEDEAYARLVAIGREAFGKAMATPGVWAFWWPRFERVARWFVRREQERRQSVRPAVTEATGEITFDAPGGPFTLTARVDRVDRRLDDGRLVFSDYKTGQPPSATEVAEGFAPQLPLEAVIAARGGFDNLPASETADLLYWRLNGGDPPAEIKNAAKPDDIETLIADAAAGLEALVAIFDDPTTPYLASPRDRRALRYSDYGHLARVQEWANADGEGSE